MDGLIIDIIKGSIPLVISYLYIKSINDSHKKDIELNKEKINKLEQELNTLKPNFKNAIELIESKIKKWECPDDDGVYPWIWWNQGNYKNCLRNFNNEVWEQNIDDNGEIHLGKWIGIYDPVTKEMDLSIPKPEFEY